jgi:hypothetical protein
MINTQVFHSNLRKRVALIAFLFLASTSLFAQQPMSAALKGSAVVPSVTTSASGAAQIMVLPSRVVSGEITVSGMEPTAAHIHEAPAGKNGPPIISLSKTANNAFSVPPDAKLTESQYTSYMAGNLYVNVHSEQHPEGEIRAQLMGKPIRIAN